MGLGPVGGMDGERLIQHLSNELVGFSRYCHMEPAFINTRATMTPTMNTSSNSTACPVSIG